MKINVLVIICIVSGLVTRAIKSKTLDMFLASHNVPPIPKKALPYVAFVVGVAAYVANELYVSGGEVTAETIVYGLIAGSGAIAGHETGRPAVEMALGPKVADFVFGERKKAEEK